MVEPYPALTPLTGQHPKGKEGEQIPGVSLDVSASVALGKKRLPATRSGFLFTHKGYSGPAVLDLSHHFVRATQRRMAAPPEAVSTTPPTPKLVVQWSSKSADEWMAAFKDPVNRATLALSLMKQELPSRLATILYDGVVQSRKNCATLTKKEKIKLSEALGNNELSVSGHQGCDATPVSLVMQSLAPRQYCGCQSFYYVKCKAGSTLLLHEGTLPLVNRFTLKLSSQERC